MDTDGHPATWADLMCCIGRADIKFQWTELALRDVAWSQSLPGLGFTGHFKHPFEPSGKLKTQDCKSTRQYKETQSDTKILGTLLSWHGWLHQLGQKFRIKSLEGKCCKRIESPVHKEHTTEKKIIKLQDWSLHAAKWWSRDVWLTNSGCEESPAPASQSYKWTDPDHGPVGLVGLVLGKRWSRRCSLHQWVSRDVAVNEMNTNC